MAWYQEVRELVNEQGLGSGRWRKMVRSTEGGGGPYGDPSHSHASAREALMCEACDEYCANVSGFSTSKEMKAMLEQEERKDLERLQGKLRGLKVEMGGHIRNEET